MKANEPSASSQTVHFNDELWETVIQSAAQIVDDLSHNKAYEVRLTVPAFLEQHGKALHAPDMQHKRQLIAQLAARDPFSRQDAEALSNEVRALINDSNVAIKHIEESEEPSKKL